MRGTSSVRADVFWTLVGIINVDLVCFVKTVRGLCAVYRRGYRIVE